MQEFGFFNLMCLNIKYLKIIDFFVTRFIFLKKFSIQIEGSQIDDLKELVYNKLKIREFFFTNTKF